MERNGFGRPLEPPASRFDVTLPPNLPPESGARPTLADGLPSPVSQSAFYPDKKPFWVTLAEARNGDLLARLEGRR